MSVNEHFSQVYFGKNSSWILKKLVGSFNPSEKYARQIGSFYQFSDENYPPWN